MNKFRLKSVFSLAKSEYIRWVTNPRMIIVGILVIFMNTLAVIPLSEKAEKFGGKLNIAEPFVAIGNSKLLVLLIPCVFLILISDYPVISGNTLFFIQRTGKLNWFFGQILFVFMAVISYLAFILIVSITVSGGEFGTDWSDAVTKYSARFPEESGNFTSMLLPSNLYNQIPLKTAVVQTFIFLAAYLFLLSLILCLFKLFNIHSFGIFAVYAVISFGVVSTFLESRMMWAFPMANTLVWMHYEEIFDKPVFPIWFSFVYFLIAIILLITVNLIALKKMQFINIEQTR